MNTKPLFLTVAACLLLLSGCTMVGPDFVKPDAPVQTEWLQARSTEIKTEPADYRDWWTVFNDPVLNNLVEEAYRQNLTLQIAGLRIFQTRAQLGVLEDSPIYAELAEEVERLVADGLASVANPASATISSRVSVLYLGWNCLR